MLGAPYTEKAKLAVFTAFSTSNTASLSKSESLEGPFLARETTPWLVGLGGAGAAAVKGESDGVGFRVL